MSLLKNLRSKLQEKYDNHESNYVTLLELIAGIVFFGLVCQILGILFLGILFSNRLGYYSAGLWIGVVTAAGLAVHMNRSLSRAVLLDSESASKVSRNGSLLRYAITLIILGILMILDFASPLTAFLGVMGLKMGAYLQPFTHKITQKIAPELCVLPEPLILLDDEEEDSKTEENKQENI